MDHEANRRPPSALIILCVACTGCALSLVASVLSIRWLYRVGFAIGVVGAIVFVMYVWWRLYLGSAPAEQQDEKTPH